MFEEYNVTCNNCGWSGKREKPDLYVPCPACNSEKAFTVLENETGFEPTVKHNPPGTIPLEEVIAKDSIDNMKETINTFGKTEVWEMIEKLVGNIKFSQIEIYLEAVGQLENKGDK